MLEAQLKCHFTQDHTVSVLELSPSLCTPPLHRTGRAMVLTCSVTSSKDLEQGHRRKKFILRR